MFSPWISDGWMQMFNNAKGRLLNVVTPSKQGTGPGANSGFAGLHVLQEGWINEDYLPNLWYRFFRSLLD